MVFHRPCENVCYAITLIFLCTTVHISSCASFICCCTHVLSSKVCTYFPIFPFCLQEKGCCARDGDWTFCYRFPECFHSFVLFPTVSKFISETNCSTLFCCVMFCQKFISCGNAWSLELLL